MSGRLAAPGCMISFAGQAARDSKLQHTKRVMTSYKLTDSCAEAARDHSPAVPILLNVFLTSCMLELVRSRDCRANLAECVSDNMHAELFCRRGCARSWTQ